MLKPKILSKYLFKEMFTPFLVSLGVFTFVLVIAKVMELTELVVSRGVSLGVVMRLLLYTMPYFLTFTLPMATLLGVLLGFLRLSTDNEITAIKAAGISLRTLLPPVFILAGIIWAFSSWLTIQALPWGNHAFENLLFKVARDKADVALKERVFQTQFPGLVVYVGRLPGQGMLHDVFIVDERDPEQQHTIVAKRGRLFPAKDNKIILRLMEGTLNAVGPALKAARTATFGTYDISLDASALGGGERTSKHEKEMYLGEMLDEMTKHPPDSVRYYLIQMELHKKFVLPFACVIMALIGIPLGTHFRGGRSWGVFVALIIFLSYYLLLSSAWSFGETGAVPVWLGMWLPNMLFGSLGVYMFWRELNEKPIHLLDSLSSLPLLWRRLRLRRDPDREGE